MAKVVLTSRPGSRYDDEPGVRYHFPQTYLKAVQAARGDWVVYYEPRRDGGRQAYVAVARLNEVIPDPQTPGHYYAYLRDYLEFPDPVPFREGGACYESALDNGGRTNLGAFQRAVRRLPEAEFQRIVSRGLGLVQQAMLAGEAPAPDRSLEYQLTRRAVRDPAFSQVVRRAYNATCALTGIRMVNGGNAAEMEAAHIKPVEALGPDSVRNGIALSRTIHWLFDRGYVSLEDDGAVLISPRGIPDPLRGLLLRRAVFPDQQVEQPHAAFLRWHREQRYKSA